MEAMEATGDGDGGGYQQRRWRRWRLPAMETVEATVEAVCPPFFSNRRSWLSRFLQATLCSSRSAVGIASNPLFYHSLLLHQSPLSPSSQSPIDSQVVHINYIIAKIICQKKNKLASVEKFNSRFRYAQVAGSTNGRSQSSIISCLPFSLSFLSPSYRQTVAGLYRRTIYWYAAASSLHHKQKDEYEFTSAIEGLSISALHSIGALLPTDCDCVPPEKLSLATASPRLICS
ncbi:hypothetical protein Ccrd_012297 [Cynara cardunculus var. scolymus]|uniref:Uncharacterized protein n=1 Tax=Cynara cardunculus var. scolymus TaxID=59895 RepID=A0A103YHN9_CYNCS|nr:hypothetical protein Ccrd_012297 [Cynara cardunculus var. scolymus]